MREGSSRIERILLLAATVVVATNVWTGCPLLAIWVASRFAGSNSLSMGAVFIVLVVLAASATALTVLLGRLSARYDHLTGRPAPARRTSPWLRSMRGEREELTRQAHGVSGVERLVALSVTAAVLAFEVWFFFFAGSSLPSG